jgi:hypothetical protein
MPISEANAIWPPVVVGAGFLQIRSLGGDWAVWTLFY